MAKPAESRLLETTAEVMEALRGPGEDISAAEAVSALTGASYKNTWSWAQSDTFPSRYFLVMIWALHKKGFWAPPELWSQVTPQARRSELEEMIAAQQRKVEVA